MESKTKTFQVNFFSKPVSVSICQLKEISCENIKTIIPQLNCALINSKLICSYDQLTSAISLTIKNYLTDSMKTRSPYTELLYTLSPSKNVTESLKTFGINEESSKAIAVRFDFEQSTKCCTLETDLKEALNCSIHELSFSNECECDFDFDLDEIKQIYKPTSNQIIGEICTIIATKNI